MYKAIPLISIYSNLIGEIISKGAFTPDANESLYSHEVGRLNIELTRAIRA